MGRADLARCIVPTAAFLVCSATVALGLWRALDVRVTASLQEAVPAAWDPWLTVFSVAGLAEVTTVIALAVFARLRRRTGAAQEAFAFLAGFAATLAVEAAFKAWLAHPGPSAGEYTVGGATYTVAVRSQLDAWLAAWPVRLPTTVGTLANAYPSGHMARTTYLLIWLWRRSAAGRDAAATPRGGARRGAAQWPPRAAARPRAGAARPSAEAPMPRAGASRLHAGTALPSGAAPQGGTRLHMLKRQGLAVGAVAFGLAMALSRVILGEHWPSDVVGGALLGWAAAAATATGPVEVEGDDPANARASQRASPHRARSTP